ncbi:site-2 protease family protein [Marinicrinis sediminis]|uniref:Site-2 protease family protein n=1 Tax=Marinicrinis sediminis TaxID=1652465 RepID=A0ABW5RDD4_9BACL
MAFLHFDLDVLPFIFLVILIAFTLHEFAHAYVAYRFGDDTAYRQGRVTLNPMAHLDLLGTLLIFLAGFGWAKPVPVNRSNFRNPRMMSVIVSAAGPLSNLIIAFVGLILMYLYFQFGWNDALSPGGAEAIETFLGYLIDLNLLLFVFNLIPLPPLDGFRILEDVVPRSVRLQLTQVSQWAVFIFLLVVFIPPLNTKVLQPILSLRYDIFNAMNVVMESIFGFVIFNRI